MIGWLNGANSMVTCVFFLGIHIFEPSLSMVIL